MSLRFLLVCLCIVFGTAEVQSQVVESRLVNITQGPVRGYREAENVFAFYSIPYATVTERFKAPDPPPTWTEAFDAIDKEIVCPQGPASFVDLTTKTMQEDCLVANVIVPITQERNLPVLVNIHGGGFQNGYGNSEKFTSLSSTKKVVVVTFNYRLGLLGFLCLGTEKVPGNAGMKDQLALLRWVKQNIAYFGGNPNDVTISGCSAGASSVDFLTISQTTKDLFNKAILDSGSKFSDFAFQQNPTNHAMNRARLLNFSNFEDITALEGFYRNASIELLTLATNSGPMYSDNLFSPCLEKDIGQETFLTESPYAILRKGNHERYPRLYGFTNMEGIMRLPQFPIIVNAMNEKFSDFLPTDLRFETQSQKDDIANIIKTFYFGNQPVSSNNLLPYVDYFTDVDFAYSILRAVKLHVRAGNLTTYLHMYSFVDNNTVPLPNTDIRGAVHCSQAMAVWDQDETRITEEYKNMKVTMREIWGNFIMTGKPVRENSSLPMWSPVGANRSPHMSLGTTIEQKGPLLEARALLWDEIYDKHYNEPVPPTTGSAFVHKNICMVYILITLYLFS